MSPTVVDVVVPDPAKLRRSAVTELFKLAVVTSLDKLELSDQYTGLIHRPLILCFSSLFKFGLNLPKDVYNA
jgi:hypothetical protein